VSLIRGTAVACIVAMAAAAPCRATDLSQRLDFNIPAQSLSAALLEFSRQAGVQVITSGSGIENLTSDGASGKLTLAEALSQLLRKSGLEFKAVGSSAIAIGHFDSSGKRARDAVPSASATADAGGVPSAQPQSQSFSHGVPDFAGQQAPLLEQVVVTGTHIRAADAVMPVMRIDRQEIETSGFSQVDRLLDNLPQNFKGGAAFDVNPTTAPGALTNQTFASGVNLRGLGTSATLVLLNGRRLAPTGLGDIVDVSLVPLSIIDHVDVLTDGASSVYGSDAVAGVVNLVTRREYNGFETFARYGATAGAKQDLSAGQLAGFTWDSGALTLAYDYRHDDRLTALSRTFSQAAAGTDLVPQQRTQAVYAGFDQRLGSGITLHIDALGGARDYSDSSVFSGITSDASGSVRSGSVGGALTVDLPGQWEGSLNGTFSHERDEQNTNYVGLGLGVQDHDVYQVASVEPRVEGPLMSLPGGSMRLATGLAYRDEQLTDTLLLKSTQSRSTYAAYGELFVPIIGEANSMRGAHRLSVSVAGRYEHYSDFGHTLNPKISIAYTPVPSLRLAMAYGTSFKAPSLFELTQHGFSTGFVFDAPDPASSVGITRTLFLDGGNANLHEERAHNATLDAKFRPAVIPGLEIGLDVFSVRYEGRILRLFPDINFTALARGDLYGDLITRGPTASQVAAALADRNVTSYVGPYDPASIQAIADLRYQNVASSRAFGQDLAVKDDIENAWGAWTVRLDVSHLSDRQRITPAAPDEQLAGLTYNPPQWRGRASLAWSRAPWGAMLRVNHVAASTDTTDPGCAPPTIACSVASWTTVDASVHYAVPSDAPEPFRNVSVSLDATNLLARNPPYVRNLGGLGYDPTNSDPLARYIALQLSRRW